MDTDVLSGGNSPSAPTTFAEAFAADASPASDPSTPSTTPPAAAQPGTETQGSPQQTEDERSPFIPRPRFDEVNTRLKDAETALADWKQHEWAKQIPQHEFQQIHQLARHFQNGDVIGGLQSLIAEIRKDPQHDAALRSLAAKQLATRTTAAPQEPQLDTIPVELGDGRIVQLATAESHQKREAWLKSQWLDEAKQAFSPFTQTVEQLQQREAAAVQQQAIESFVTTTERDLASWPLMDDPANRKALAEELQRTNVNQHDPREIRMAIDAAYRKLIVPKLTSKGESSLLDDLKRKAAATSMNPGSAASATAKSYQSFHDLGPEMWK